MGFLLRFWGLSSAGLCACLQDFWLFIISGHLVGCSKGSFGGLGFNPVVLLGRFISYAAQWADRLNY